MNYETEWYLTFEVIVPAILNRPDITNIPFSQNFQSVFSHRLTYPQTIPSESILLHFVFFYPRIADLQEIAKQGIVGESFQEHFSYRQRAVDPYAENLYRGVEIFVENRGVVPPGNPIAVTRSTPLL